MDLKTAYRSALLKFGNPVKQCKVGNYTIDVDTREGIQRAIYLGCYEPDETHWLHEILIPGMTFVDVGANVGYYSFIASSLVKNKGMVCSFEPSEVAYDSFVSNIRKNHISNIFTTMLALGDTEGEMKLFSADGLSDNIYNIHSPSFLNREDQQYLKEGHSGSMGLKHITTLDNICKVWNVNHIDLVKIDVEGMELPVLKGMKSLLDNKQVDHIMIEFLEEKGSVFAEGSETKKIYDFIGSYGFRMRSTKRYNERYWNILYEKTPWG